MDGYPTLPDTRWELTPPGHSVFEEFSIEKSGRNYEAGDHIHLNVLCLKYVSKVQSYDDHVCRELLELSHKVGRTSFYDKLLFKKFI